MSGRKMVKVEDVSRKIILRKAAPNARLDEQGQEKLDPVPHSVAMNLSSPPSIDQRISTILRLSEIRRNPNYGMDNDDENDFDVGDEIPTLDFERRHEALEAAREALELAEKEVQEAEEEAKEKRRQAYIKKMQQIKAKKVDAEIVEDAGPKDD